jgi:hypothetical protein
MLTKVLAPLKQDMVAVPLAIFLIANAGLLSDSPPEMVRTLMTHPVVRLVILFIICVLLAKGVNKLAYMLTIATAVLFIAVQRIDLVERVVTPVVQTVRTLASPVVKVGEKIATPVLKVGHAVADPFVSAGRTLAADVYESGSHLLD